MINKNEMGHDEHYCHPHLLSRMSWTAIFVGALIGIGLTFLLNVFGFALGLSAFTVGADGVIVLAIGGFLGMLVGVIASMLAAGYAAGYLGRTHCPKRNLGMLYGFTTWSVALLLTSVVATQMSAYMMSYSHSISHSVFVVSDDKASHPFTMAVKDKSSAENNQKVMKVTMTPAALAGWAFSVFILFFVSALASCFGACWGMDCKRED